MHRRLRSHKNKSTEIGESPSQQTSPETENLVNMLSEVKLESQTNDTTDINVLDAIFTINSSELQRILGDLDHTKMLDIVDRAVDHAVDCGFSVDEGLKMLGLM